MGIHAGSEASRYLAVAGLLSLSWWLATLGAVFASGAFPAARRPAELRGPVGSLSVWLLVAGVVALAGVSVSASLPRAPWPWMMVAAGLGSVLAPPFLDLLPEPLADRPLGAVVLAGGCLAATAGWLALEES